MSPKIRAFNIAEAKRVTTKYAISNSLTGPNSFEPRSKRA